MGAGPAYDVGGVNDLNKGVKCSREVPVDRGQIFYKAWTVAEATKPLQTQERVATDPERNGWTRLEEGQFPHSGVALAYH